MPSDEMPSGPSEDRTILDRRAADPHATWAYGAHPDQVADVYLPAVASPSRAVVVLIHGGFWRPDYDRAHLRPLVEALAERGHLAVSLEYRRQPGHPDLTIDDVAAALAALPALLVEHGADARPVVVVGHSAGGHLALWVAGESLTSAAGPASGVLALAPVADLALADALALDGGAVSEFLGASAQSRPDLDPARRRPPVSPVTVVHGTEDSLVPLAASQSYAAAIGAAVRLVELPGTGHFALIDPAGPAWTTVVAEIDRLALPGPAGIE